MKIGVVGCGAVGSFYGARLSRAGGEVHFLLRSDYAAVRESGVCIRSVDGDFVAHPRAAASPGAIGICDLVVIALKTTANDCFEELLPPLVGPATWILTLQNGLGNEEALAERFDPDAVFGGLCFVCLNRIQPGVIRHTAHGHIVMGEHRRSPGERVRRMARLFEHAGVSCRITDDLDRAHWEKLVWNIPFNGLGVAGIVGWDCLDRGRVPERLPRTGCLATDELLGSARGLEWLQGLMGEVIATARALGHELPDGCAEENLARTRCMGDYRASTLVDFENGLPIELNSLFLEPRRLARETGVGTPRLDALCAVLGELDARRLTA